MLLKDDDVEAAWGQAQLGGCSPTLWMQLADLREHEHPEDAIPIYRVEVERAIETKHNRGYEAAIALMTKVRALMEHVGHGEDFASYAAVVRTAHKPKRNLMTLFDQNGW